MPKQGVFVLIEYRLLDYEVWGNARDGWDINGCQDTGKCIIIETTHTKKDILKSLKDQGYLSDACSLRNIVLDNSTYENAIEIYEKKGMKPLGRLELK